MNTYENPSRELLDFLDGSPTSFHAVKNIGRRLEEEGFQPLTEDVRWDLRSGGKYYVTRKDSALIAFTVPKKAAEGFHITASHSDSPCFKIKENPEIVVENHYTKLNVEKYGGMIMSTWLDRPLSVAGRVIVKENGAFVSKLVNIDRDLLIIPNLAIHMNREVNKGYAFNVQQDLLPLFGDGESKGGFLEMIRKEAGVKGDILGHDLYLYNRQKGVLLGNKEEYVGSGRLDDLQCVFGALLGFLKGKKEDHIAVYCVLDNEEVGSETTQGAASTFLKDVLMRISYALGRDEEDYRVSLAKSFMISADNAHAVHPNHPDKSDPSNRVYLNGGVVLKMNGEQKYCTDGISEAVFKDLCKEAGVPVQIFVNRSDTAGGSTLGNICSYQIAVNAVDVGLPQLAMHAAYETAGTKDLADFIKVCEKFFA